MPALTLTPEQLNILRLALQENIARLDIDSWGAISEEEEAGFVELLEARLTTLHVLEDAIYAGRGRAWRNQRTARAA